MRPRLWVASSIASRLVVRVQRPRMPSSMTRAALPIGLCAAVNSTFASRKVEPFVRDPGSLELWSRDFFMDVARRIEIV